MGWCGKWGREREVRRWLCVGLATLPKRTWRWQEDEQRLFLGNLDTRRRGSLCGAVGGSLLCVFVCIVAGVVFIYFFLCVYISCDMCVLCVFFSSGKHCVSFFICFCFCFWFFFGFLPLLNYIVCFGCMRFLGSVPRVWMPPTSSIVTPTRRAAKVKALNADQGVGGGGEWDGVVEGRERSERGNNE